MGPAEVFPLASYLVDEMQERGWKTGDVALRMGGNDDYGLHLFCLELILAVDDDTLLIDDDTFDGLAKAFDVSSALLRNLDANWRRWPDRRVKFVTPEQLFTGGNVRSTH